MPQPLVNDRTDEQKSEPALWLHKKARMEFIGAGDLTGCTEAVSMGATADAELALRRYQGAGYTGLGRTDDRFLHPNGFTIQMWITPRELDQAGDRPIATMLGVCVKNSYLSNHYLRLYVGGNSAVISPKPAANEPLYYTLQHQRWGGSGTNKIAIDAGVSGAGSRTNWTIDFWPAAQAAQPKTLLTVAWDYSAGEFKVYRDSTLVATQGTGNKYPTPFGAGNNYDKNYVEGAAIPAMEYNGNNSSGLRAKGNEQRTGGAHFVGDIEDFRYYGNKILTASEVNAIYQAAANQAPTSADKTVTMYKNTTFEMTASTAADLMSNHFTDGGAPPNTYHSLIITELPLLGKTFLGNTQITSAPKTIVGAAILNLKYTPVTDGEGSPYAFFKFKVSDGSKSSAEHMWTFNVISPNVPATGNVFINGGDTVSDVLQGSHSIDESANKGIATGPAWQWKRNGANIAGATGATYTLVNADAGKNITLRLDWTDRDGYTENKTSASYGPIQANPLSSSEETAIDSIVAPQHIRGSYRLNTIKLGPIMTSSTVRITRRKRHRALKRIFANNAARKAIIISKDQLKFDFKNLKNIRDDITVIKPGESISSTGNFYSPITNVGEFIKITPSVREGMAPNFYYASRDQIQITVTKKATDTTNAEYDVQATGSGTLVSTQGTAAAGKWQDGDIAVLNGLKFEFGGIAADGSVGGSSVVVSGGLPHLHRTDVSGAPIDASAVRSVARADVAELRAEITPGIDEEPEHHLVNIAAKRALTVTEFKQMFYARGDGIFALSNVYECPNLSSNILASVWGKRVSYTKLGPGTPVEFTLRSIANVTTQISKPANFFVAAVAPIIYHGDPATSDGIPKKTEAFTVWDAYGTPVTFEWSSSRPSGLILSQPGRTDNGVLPARVNVNNSGDFPPELGFSWIEIAIPAPMTNPIRILLTGLGEFQIDSLADGT